MLKIRFMLFDSQASMPIGFNLGDIAIVGELGEATSQSRSPNQSMMLILSMVELLDGLRRFLLVFNVNEYRFIGVDSSFCIVFRKCKSFIAISVDDKPIHTTTASSLKKDIEQSILEFMRDNDLSAIATGAETNDLNDSVRAFRET